MKRILIAIILAATFSLHATAPPRGADRLRELVIFPEIDFSFNWGISCQNNEWVISQTVDLPSAITEQREELKRQPDDVKRLMQLAYLLDSNGETNESQSCYQKAGQLYRNKIAANPQDGLSLTGLGAALDALGKEDEAEHDFRKATLVSSNEWRCWTGLGNFLENDSFGSMFSKNIRNVVAPMRMPSPAVLDYRPPPETLKKSESLCREAAQCFDRAMAIAPKEPEVFVQCAGYASISNLQNCYIRYYRDNEKITTNEWLLSFISPQTIANLKTVAGLKPKDYQYISLAAYFEYFVPMMKSHLRNDAHFMPDMLPDQTRQSIHAAMTRLENLSEDADKKNAAGALENLGMLNMIFGNKLATITDLRRAVALDSTRQLSWNLLLVSLMEEPSPDESQIEAICQSKLKADDSAFNHLIYSKTLVRMKKWDEAAKQAVIAGRQETNNIVPPLMLAAIALKQSNEAKYLYNTQISLEFANALLNRNPADKESPERWRELLINGAILNLLVDKPQSALPLVNQVLKRFPNDSTATELLKYVNAG